MIIRGVIHNVQTFVFFSLLTFRKIIEKRPVFKVSPFKSCENAGGIYCLLLTRIFAKMLKNRKK